MIECIMHNEYTTVQETKKYIMNGTDIYNMLYGIKKCTKYIIFGEGVGGRSIFLNKIQQTVQLVCPFFHKNGF